MDDARHNEWRMDFSWRGTPLKSLHCLIASSLQGSSLRQFPHRESPPFVGQIRCGHQMCWINPEQSFDQ